MTTQFKAGDRVIVRFKDSPSEPRKGTVLKPSAYTPYICVRLDTARMLAHHCLPSELELI